MAPGGYVNKANALLKKPTPLTSDGFGAAISLREGKLYSAVAAFEDNPQPLLDILYRTRGCVC
tara:strand:- start:838 stop:1026 length:189 start_codon:yes stop_codon:yes gene_type:complete